MRHDVVIRRFSLSQDDLLGFGGESRVYALNEQRVLRVYERGVDRDNAERLRRFYESLSAHDLPFELPVVLDLDELDGILYAIEQRIYGDQMTNFLKTATGEARMRSLVSYVKTANRIQELPVEASEFGELLVPKPMRRPAWAEYLAAHAHDSLSRGGDNLQEDVPDLGNIVAAWEKDLELVSDITAPSLVHGDYFPGNVMVDERGLVIAVIDFSPMTVAGDPRLDVLCALIFIEVDHGYQPGDSETVRQLIEARHGEGVLRLADVYRTYYSLYFSPVKTRDPRLYKWCVENLTERR